MVGLLTSDALFALATLTAMEVVLGMNSHSELTWFGRSGVVNIKPLLGRLPPRGLASSRGR